ncbi:MAG: OB-fold nucleic acid binding domain-containing protein, partial [Candidatus Omnitrophota bacterium]
EPQLLSFEKEMLGFYISGHPLARYSEYLKRFSFSSTQDLKNSGDGKEVKITGLIAKIKNATTRAKNEKMAILKLEDLQGEVEVLVFPNAYRQYSRVIQPNRIILIKGRLNLKEDTPKIIASELIPLEEFYKLINAIEIDLSGVRENIFTSIKEKLSLFPGKVPVYLHLDTNNRSKVKVLVGQDLFVQPNEELVKEIESLVGEKRFSLTL